MKTQHTPGKWIVQADPVHKGKHPYHDCRYVTTNHELVLDEDRVEFDTFERDAQLICTMPDAEFQKGNAMLIAAAPELLEALQELTKLVTQTDYAFHPANVMARLVIERATGGKV